MLLFASLSFLALAGDPEPPMDHPDTEVVQRVDRQPRTEVAVSFGLPSDAFSAFNYRSVAVGLRASRRGDILGVGVEGVVMLLPERPTQGFCAGDCLFGPQTSWRAAVGPTVLADLPLWRGAARGGVEAAVGPSAAMLTLNDPLLSAPDRRARLGGQARLSLRMDLHRQAAIAVGVHQHWARIASRAEVVLRDIEPAIEWRTLFEVAFVARVPDVPARRPRAEPEPDDDEPPELR